MASQDVIITIRMLMIGKEIGGIIGKGGANINGFREQSGAKITISTAQSCPERIVTVTGGQSQIHKAVQLMTEKIHMDLNVGLLSDATNKIPVTIRLIVPASQCGSIIGKGGQKIKEIRDTTGCAIQVQSEMLPNSSERTVTLSGAPSTIVHCIDVLCDVMIQYPAKTATVPYQPQGNNPVLMHKNQTYMLHGQFPMAGEAASGYRGRGDKNKMLGSFGDGGQPEVESMVSPGSQISFNFPSRMISTTIQELYVPNDVVGCIIGKGGARIKEIRMLSAAQIKIDRIDEPSDPFDRIMPNSSSSLEEAGQIYRKILICGSPDSICYAQYLINLSVQVYGPPEKNIAVDQPPPQQQQQQQPDAATSAPILPISQHKPPQQVVQRPGGINSLLGHPPNILSLEHEQVEWMHRDQNPLTSGVCYF